MKHSRSTNSRFRLFTVVSIALASSVSAMPSDNLHSASEALVHSNQELTVALERARAGKVRTIRFARGRYALAVPIVIDNRLSGTPDAPFTLEAAPGAKVELSGARALPALRWEATTAGVWRARLAIAPFQRLWLGDEAQVRARYPNYDPAVLPYGGVAADATSPERVARWANPAGGVMQALHGSRWGDVHVPILGKNPEGTLRYGPEVGNNRAAPPSVKERFVENIREELDAPHEW